MRICLNITKSVHENAAFYYENAKEIRRKIIGVENAIEETKKEITKAEKEFARKKELEKIKIVRKKEWYEKFHYFFTSSEKLVIGGKSADQNDLIYKTYFNEKDLFFHADIQGGSACILKSGFETDKELDENELKEVAQFAACFSNAWKNKVAAVDVYAVHKEQVSKHANKGFIAKGAFAILGERKWFRKTELKLKIGIISERNLKIPVVLPVECKRKLEKEVFLVPGNNEKGEVVKKLAKILNVHPDEIQNLLPAGRTNLI